MADPQTGRRIRKYAELRRREAFTEAAVRQAMKVLLYNTRVWLVNHGMNPDMLDSRMPEWRAEVESTILPVVEDTYIAALREAAAAGTTVDAAPYAARHLETVHNRLVGVADTVFDAMRTELRDGNLAGEGIPELTARVDALLADSERWNGRARTIARTEVIGANNAGARDGATALAALLGHDTATVAKRWLSTIDHRTRQTHADANGQTVIGMSTPFVVGGATLQQAGDPAAPGREVINCRCTVLYLMPGDPGYPATTAGGRPAMTTTALPTIPRSLAAAAEKDPNLAAWLAELSEQFASKLAVGPEDDPDPTDDATPDTASVVVALPAPDDPINDIGPEQKHATILWFGVIDQEAMDAIAANVAAVAAASDAFSADVTGVQELGDDDPPAQVVMLDGEALSALHDTLLDDEATRTAWEATKQFPTYTPHVTLGYGDAVTPEDVTAAGELASVSFDRLACWFGEDQMEYPLAAAADDTADEPPPEDTADAAGATHRFAATPDVAVADVEQTDLMWDGVLLVEGVGTGDFRRISEEAVGWMNDPGVLFAMFDGGTGFGGHEDQVPVGVIRNIAREGEKLTFGGTWSSSEDAAKARTMNIDGELRGVSADMDSVSFHLEDGDGNPIEGDAIFDLPIDAEIWQVIDSARIRGATLWAIPAFVEAYVLDSTVADQVPDTSWASAPKEQDPLAVAAAGAMVTRTQRADSSAFAYPGEDNLHAPDGTPLGMVVTDDRNIFGYLATWGTCHIGYDGVCITPPTSETDYAWFLTGDYPTSDGQNVNVGQITMDTGHAPLNLRMRPAAAHYDNTGHVAADISVGEDDTGIWYAGVLRPDLTEEAQLALRAAGRLSGDWRDQHGNLELMAALGVNVPGFPIPKVQSRVASGRQVALVASGIPPQVASVEDLYGDGFQLAVARAVRTFQANEARRADAGRRLRKLRADRARSRLVRS